MADLQQQLRDAIRSGGHSVPELAGRAGVHVVNLRQFLGGSRSFPLATCERLAQEIGLQVGLVVPVEKNRKSK